MTMTSRIFSLSLIAGMTLLFLSTVGANVLLDPEQVFGTGLYPHSVNANERVLHMRQYQQDADSVDGLLFSSSRGMYFDSRQLEKGMGLSHFLAASMTYGMVSDYVPILEYVIRDKAARSVKLKHVFLLLDLDLLGRPPWTNSNINSFLPPEVSEESAARFWWRYLTAFQYRYWRDVIREGRQAEAAKGTTVRSPLPIEPEDHRRAWNVVRPDLERQLKLLERLVALCRDNQVKLTVAISPLRARNLEQNDPVKIEAIAERVARITPVWDFNFQRFFADNQDYWVDNSHFTTKVASMMLAQIFGEVHDATAPWGRLREKLAP